MPSSPDLRFFFSGLNNKQAHPDTLPKQQASPHAAKPTDLNPSKPIKKITWSYRCKRTVELYPDIPSDKPRQPTPEEIQHALQVSQAKPFDYFQHRKVVIMDKNDQSKILAVIEFTPLKDLTQTKQDKINLVTSFLYKTKQFVNSVLSSSRSWGGYMWAIGWRKSSTAFELIGRYLNQDAINLAPDVYDSVMKLSAGVSDILGGMFHKLSGVAFKDNQTLMLKNHIPGFASLEFDAPLNKNNCSPNLTFTTSGFFNPPHVDSKDISKFAFVLFVPININNGTLVSESDDYGVTGK
ncbi:hypothetical protein PCASD_01895 [Puccinia coronata f. sp. avenae]|uniref:Tet-like 2OG-Fe(II) oxygenase domain-containing protein n=1 Tax=Puccinia coronata f. sp. avenae TaxID=200324 RepID=A0A2N5VJL5_9BASI|nr:hypothetical protein PCASD_01895 [Puccinia coronata f. sp. avenae]